MHSPAGSFARDSISLTTRHPGSGCFSRPKLTGEFGFQLAPDPVAGQEVDRDFLDDTDCTHRALDGAGAAAQFVCGVIALMLEANANPVLAGRPAGASSLSSTEFAPLKWPQRTS